MIITCPGCNKKLKTKSKSYGDMVSCPNCTLRFQIIDERPRQVPNPGSTPGQYSMDAFEGVNVSSNWGSGGSIGESSDRYDQRNSINRDELIQKAFIIASVMAIVLPVYLLFASGPIESKSAREVFDNFERLSQSYDQRLTDLYLDDATIYFKRYEYRSGKKEAITMKTMTGTGYKVLMSQALPLAKELGDYDTFSNVVFKERDGYTLIEAKRHNARKRQTSPVYWTVKSVGENWYIKEQVTFHKR